jgi:nucleotide-binding universal stress UspA family protein
MTDTENGAESVQYERIVVPLDLSKRAELALVHARTLAKSLGVPIHLLRVVDITPLAQAAVIASGIDDLAFRAIRNMALPNPSPTRESSCRST